METICKLVTPVIWDFVLIFVSLVFILGIFAIFYFFHKFKIHGIKLYVGLPVSIVIFLFILFATFIGFIFLDDFNRAIASRYFAINGEIKLACLYPGDTNSRICPKTKGQVLDFDESFKELLFEKEWDYKYYPDKNEYTLFIKHDWFRGAIFDPLLGKLGYLDLVETTYDCAGNITAYPVSKEIWDKYINLRQGMFPILKSSRNDPTY
ncbi:MAG: hypothetical protein Q7S14_03695 [bacterium]|nr:hypothetical protein [bacterium]